ncbi:hypothetical protein GIB67_007255 [Kingdonia uniflora]|uniref:Uncharacterized protein n=1 Tax=Kingdonia uniflora TaxID=39325 RepID=A0A7J7NXS0_9MAGN|nr:hypothetical protein GIB67_007255 [Kingdonia uniflora]
MANSRMIQTYFNSDEPWQTLEVAHRIAFGRRKLARSRISFLPREGKMLARLRSRGARV